MIHRRNCIVSSQKKYYTYKDVRTPSILLIQIQNVIHWYLTLLSWQEDNKCIWYYNAIDNLRKHLNALIWSWIGHALQKMGPIQIFDNIDWLIELAVLSFWYAISSMYFKQSVNIFLKQLRSSDLPIKRAQNASTIEVKLNE